MPIFKPYVEVQTLYKGGKSLKEIGENEKKIYKLSSNENPIGCSPHVTKAVQEASQNLHLYPERTAIELERAIAAFEGLDESQVIATNSGSESLQLIISAFVEPGDEVILSNPAFLPYEMFSSWAGAKVIDVPLVDPNFSLDVSAIKSKITERTRIIYLTSPNNPTGTYLPKNQIDALLEDLPDHCLVVLDEVYHHFATAADFTRALPYVREQKNVIAVNSLSKGYGLASLRVGYLYSTEQLSSYIRKIVRPFLVNSISLAAGQAALKDQDFLQQVVSLVNRNRTRVLDFLKEHGVAHYPSQTNFVLTKPAMNDVEFTAAMLEEGIMVRPVANFGAPEHVRITIGDDEATDALILALKKVLKL